MSRFNVGDIVRVSKRYKETALPEIREIGDGVIVTTEFSFGVENYIKPIHVFWDNGCGQDLWKESDLKLVRRSE